MTIDYQKAIDDAVYKKLNKLTINEIRIVINQLQLHYKRAYSPKFYHDFVTNVRINNDEAISNLYTKDLNMHFSNENLVPIQQMAEKYQKNQMNQAIRKHVNAVFDEKFKAKYQNLIKQIAQLTMQNTPF